MKIDKDKTKLEDVDFKDNFLKYFVIILTNQAGKVTEHLLQFLF